MSQKNPEKNPQHFLCEICDYNTSNKKDYNKHLTTSKHKNKSIINDFQQNEDKSQDKSHFFTHIKFVCELCNYNSNSNKDYKKHLLTSKHINKTTLISFNKEEEKFQKDKTYKCNNCNKIYKKKNSLWYHNKKCIKIVSIDTCSNEIKSMTNLMIELVKSNNDLQKQFLEICKNNNSNNINNNVINSNNKTFNLNFFLNEECKDAMNLSDFVNSIQLKISDLENIGKVGYVEGISNIIIKELNDTEINKRPVHCSDVKRETIYVKEENKWEKDTDETKKMVKAVLDVDKKASKLLVTKWKEANPNFSNSNSKQSEMFVNLVGEISNGDESNVKKVIKRVAKQVVIDK